MTRRGRKPTGTNLVEHLEGSERAKARLKAILETLSGQRSIPEVCEELGIQRIDVPSRAQRGAPDGAWTVWSRVLSGGLRCQPSPARPAGRRNWKKRTFACRWS